MLALGNCGRCGHPLPPPGKLRQQRAWPASHIGELNCQELRLRISTPDHLSGWGRQSVTTQSSGPPRTAPQSPWVMLALLPRLRPAARHATQLQASLLQGAAQQASAAQATAAGCRSISTSPAACGLEEFFDTPGPNNSAPTAGVQASSSTPFDGAAVRLNLHCGAGTPCQAYTRAIPLQSSSQYKGAM